MDKKVIRFLGRSFAIMVIVSVIIFTILTVFMSGRTRESVNEISDIICQK